MSSAVEEHVIYQIANAGMREYPYPHIYVEQVFPADFYAQLRANWPDSSALVTLGALGRVAKDAYPDRFVMPLSKDKVAALPDDSRVFWTDLASWLLKDRFMNSMVEKFGKFVEQRFGHDASKCRFGSEALLVRDRTNYAIGPHTDAPHRLLSMLFYCPDDTARKHLGTSIYVPGNLTFRCVGGPHYKHALFQKVTTMEYQPNSLFAFFKTDHSFHGVEPISDADVQRDVLLYDIRVEESELQTQAAKATSPSFGIKLLRGLLNKGH